MRLLCWARGLRTFRDLKDFIHVHKPELIFLIETKMTSVQMGKILKRSWAWMVSFVFQRWRLVEVILVVYVFCGAVALLFPLFLVLFILLMFG